MSCALCKRVELATENKYPYMIQEMENSFLMLGEHQYYEGYCVLVAKNHYREMTDIPPDIRAEIFKEMMLSHQVIQNVFAPKKMNMCSLGNVVDHVHWHFFPRYETDPNFKNPPWLQMHEFDGAKMTTEEARKVIERLRAEFQNLLSSVK